MRGYTIKAVILSGGSSSVPSQPQAPSDGATVEDVVLDWHPIDGATTYRLQISTDSNFLSGVTTVTGITSTRYSPATTLDNDQYWWRVAPVNADGVQTPFSETTPVWTFIRGWDDQPQLLAPADNASVSRPFYFQWTPTQLASRYRVEMHTNNTFTPSNEIISCTTVHTTYVPSRDSGDCWPGAANTYYWRVVALDDPKGVDSEVILSEVHRFTYTPDLVTQLSPADGGSVQVPTLSWEPYPEADEYRVTITNVSSGSSDTQDTITTTFTWPDKLTVGATYRWQVRPIFHDGRLGASLLAASQPTFSVLAQDAPVASTPSPATVGPADQRPPLLTWDAVTGATGYKIQVRVAGSGSGWTYLNASDGTTYPYPSGNDTTGLMTAPGTYEWRVETVGTNPIVTGPSSTYTILPFATVGGYRAALNGNASGSPATSCTATLPSGCENLRQTPVLRWNPVPGAAYYKLIISRDQNLTNLVLTQNVRGTNMWMHTSALPDADAGTAYYWDVLPCGPSGVCANQLPAQHRFNKQGLPVQLVSPLNGVERANDITFTWTDYLDTLLADSGANSSLTTPAGTEARQYRIQVSTVPDFSSLLDSKVVDQRTYTPWDRTYPEQQLFWRVQAIDGSENPMPWSQTGIVVKKSPGPVLSVGHDNTVYSGSITLGWLPLAYAKNYQVQVFPLGAAMDTTTPLLNQTGQKQNSYTPATTLSPGNYQWRVRRADADDRYGQWSATGHFSSQGAAPVLLNPATGATVDARGALFTWTPSSPTAPAASYRLNLVAPSGTTSPAGVTTSARAYAWPALLANGTWSWTVTALDGSGAALGTSSSRTFVVNYPTLVTITKPSFTGTRTVGSTLTASPGTFGTSAAGPAVAATYSYQWLRSGSPIAGATGKTRKLVAADAGRTISVRVTASGTGYSPGTATSGGGVIAKISSTTKVSLKSSTIKRGTRGTMYVTVTAALPETGYLRIYDGSRLLRTFTLTTAMNGKKTYLLPILTLGKHSLQARYAGNSQIKPSNSARVTLSVVR